MKFAGLQIKVEKNAVYACCMMVIVFVVVTGVIGLVTGDLRESSIVDVFVVALAAASFHFFAQFIHMIGHALAAWAVGYPKSGMVFMYVFAMSLYPPDEPALPHRIHIQRSLGGVVAFALLLIIVLALWIGARSAPQWTVRYLTSYMLLDAILLFAVSALVSDGVLFIVRKEWLSQSPKSKTSL
jgi:hypothetical protein